VLSLEEQICLGLSDNTREAHAMYTLQIELAPGMCLQLLVVSAGKRSTSEKHQRTQVLI
jgi:hypothetical protein